MGFAVTRPGGTKDIDYQDYARVLRYRGVDLGKVPRVPDPFANQRWLYLWNSQAEAQAFLDELKEQSADPAWVLVEMDSPASEGPLGPLVIQLVRQTTGLTFGLDTLSRVVIRSAFPQAVSAMTYARLDPPDWSEFREKRGGLSAVVRLLAPNLTGLDSEQLDTIGYVVIDADTDRTLVSVPPALLRQVGKDESSGPGSAGDGPVPPVGATLVPGASATSPPG